MGDSFTQVVAGHLVTPSTVMISRISILWQELFASVAACHMWGHKWTSKCIKFYCENLGVVEVINSRTSKAPRVMDLVRDLTLCTSRHNCHLQAVHVPGKHNILLTLSLSLSFSLLVSEGALSSASSSGLCISRPHSCLSTCTLSLSGEAQIYLGMALP